MAVLSGNGGWASEVAKAFGEDPTKIRRMDIHIAVNEVVTVEIERIVDKENDVYEIIRKHAWVEIPTEPEEE